MGMWGIVQGVAPREGRRIARLEGFACLPAADRTPEMAKAGIFRPTLSPRARLSPGWSTSVHSPAALPQPGRSAQPAIRLEPAPRGPAQVADLSEPDQRGQSRTQIPLSFGIASLAFKFREKKGRTIWTKRGGLWNG